MKKIFRKAITVLGSAALIGATVGTALAASYPAPFTSNTAIVVGANAAPQDNIGASNIASNLDAAAAGASVTTLTGATGVTEDEVVFATQIDTAGYKIESTLTDSKISSLLDQKISWDDGDGSDDYDIHESIIIGDMEIITTLTDEDLEGVALTNNMGLEYRYYFDDNIPISASTAADADDLYLTILGQSYEIQNITADTISVVTSEEVSVGLGESVTVGGETFTVDDLSSTSARINGVTIADGSSKKINGLQVEVDEGSIFYNENFPEQASLTLKIGEDISKTYTNGDEYIGEDEDDPLWVWTIVNAASDGGHIGVKYNVNTNDADDDDAGSSIKYVGDSYMLPNNFGAVTLEGLTDVDYEEVTVKFVEKDLYNAGNSTAESENSKVIVISAASTSSISVNTASEETDEIYLFYANNNTYTNTSSTYGAIEVFYRDHEGDDTPTNKARFEIKYALNLTNGLERTEIASIEVGDTDLTVDLAIDTNGMSTLYFENPDSEDIALNISGVAIANTTGDYTKLGVTADDADAGDIKVNGTDVSTKEESIMDSYGIIVAEDDSAGVEGNANDDEVTLSVPSDQVYAIVSVVAGGDATTTGEAGVMTVMDTAVSSVAGKNLVVVGGSAINSVAAELLGGAYREGAFTSATGVAAGEFLIQSFSRSGKTALLVAGYNAADTEKAVTYLLNNDVDTTVGTKMKGTSATQATVVTA